MEKKYILFALCFILSGAGLNAQNYEWAKSYGTASSESGSRISAGKTGNIYVTLFGSSVTRFNTSGDSLGSFNIPGSPTGITLDSIENIHIAGTTGGGDFDPGPGTAIIASGRFFAKYDSAGNYLWAKSINIGAGNIEGIAVDTAGNVFITGYFPTGASYDFDPGPGTNTLTSVGGNDRFIAKYDVNGNYLWAYRSGGFNADYSYAIVTDSIGNAYITGSTGNSSADIYIAKYYDDGTLAWERGYASAAFDAGYGIITDGVAVYITGGFSVGVANVNIIILKYDTSGTFKLAKNFGSSSSDYGLSITIDKNRDINISGYFSNIVDFDPGAGTSNLSSTGGFDVFFAKYDTAFNFLYARNVGGNSSDEGESIAADTMGNLYIAGYFNGSADFDPGAGTANLTSNGSSDLFVAKYNCHSTNTISPSVCYTYTVPSGDETYTVSGTYMDTIPTVSGCDSILIINLTVYDSTTATLNLTVCDSYTVPSGDETYTVSGTYMDTIPNAAGCDSILIINLTVYVSTAATINPTACDSYTVPSGDETYTVSGTYNDTIPNTAGCDSILTINLTINPVYSIADAPVALCNGDSALLYGSYRKTTGTYYDSLLSVNGCDSVRLTILTVNPVFNTITSAAICSGDSILLQGNYQTTVGTYYDTLASMNGCDSVIATTLTVNQVYSIADAPVAICNGDSTLLYGSYRKTTGNYYDSLLSVNNCDSVRSTILTVNPVYNTITSAAICSGDSILLQGSYQTTAGTYYDTLVTVNGCDSVIATTLTVNPAITLSMNSPGATCGISDGLASVAAIGGTPPFSYLWDDTLSQTTDTATGLSAGSYSVVVTDLNGCAASGSVNVNNIGAPVIAIDSLIDARCFGGNDGKIFITPSGNGPFTFYWSDGSTTEDVISLSQGAYFVTVTDTNSCARTNTATINQPPALTVSETHLNIICNGGNNGSIDLALSGGTPPYAHNWGGGIITEDRAGIAAGSYSDTITDANFCTATVNVVITQPPALILTEAHTDISCNGGNNGTVNLSVAGGTGSYSYIWTTGATTQDISGVNAGSYTVSVADANSCTSVLSVLLTEPSALAIAETHTNISCNGGGNGAIDVTASGGTLAYSYSWGDGPATEDRANLAAATYSLTVTDAKGCTAAVSIGITQPSLLALTINKNDNACNSQCNGDATVFPSGGTLPYSYLWSNSETSNSATGLCSGYVYLTVTDMNGCTAADSASITEPTPLAASVTSTDVTCNNGFDGTAAVAVSGGSGTILYQWSGGETTSSVTGLYSWVYTVNVIDFMCSDTIPLNVIINQPPALNMTPGSVNASCGNNDGTAWVDVSGGTPPYAYLWNDSLAQANDTASALSAGQYTITVTDSVGCTAALPVTVNNNGAPIITIDSVIKVSCSGGADGAVFISVSGTVPFTYLWSDSATSEDNTMLVKGVYQVTVADGSGCLAFGPPRTVGEPRPLDTRMAASAVLCNGDSSGWAAVTASGGTPPFTYQWSDPLAQTSDTAFGLSADTFSVTVSDVKGCTLADDTIVSEPLALNGAVTATGVSCYGDSNGTAGISISGGTSPYTYLWNTGDTLPAVSNLVPAVYSITVSDSNGCTLVSSASVAEPAMLAVAFNITGASCNGVCDGVAGANVSGGTPPYNYLWSNSAIAANIMGLCAGNYYLTVTDSNGCTLNDSISITEPLLLTLSIAGTDVSCNGGNDGSATAAPTGGTPPYSYLWNTSVETQGLASLQAGIYFVTVTDTNLCSVSNSVNIGEPLSLTATVTGTDVSCNGGNDGTATVAAAGGSGNYQYTWTTGDSVATIGNLAFGTYDVTVVDISCTDTAMANVVINEPSAITVVPGSADAGCGSSDGMAWAVPSGGTAPFGIYGYLWDDPLAQVTDTATGLAAGSYSVTVDDDNGCTATGFVSVLNTGAPAVTVDSTSDAACFGNNDGAIYLSVSGAGQMTFNWSNGGTDEDISGLIAGTYDVTVTDSAGCVNFTSAAITEPVVLSLSVNSTDASCNGLCDGTATSNVNGGTPPYTYAWDDPSASTINPANALCAGIFSVTVTDANGCTVTGSTVVNEPAGTTLSFATTPVLCFGDSTGYIDLTVSGATGGYVFIWSNGAITEDISGLNGNTYYVTVTDSTGCSTTDTLLLTEPAALSVVLTSMNASCNGLCDGYASASGGGGTFPYFYAWSNAETGTLVTGLCPGTYYVTITDTNGCAVNDSLSITEPAALTVIASATDITCNGLCDGSVNVVANGGTTPYTGDGINTGLCGGTFSYTVTDANGCTATNSASIVEPPALIIDTMTMTVASCPDTSCKDGSASVIASGGTGTLTYSWSNGGNTGTISNLNSDTFYVTVTDANGCTATASVFVDFLVGGFERPMFIDGQLLVYPNPNKGIFNVEFLISNFKFQNVNLEIQNILSETVFSAQCGSASGGQSAIKNIKSTISLNLPEGIYALRVEADGEVIGMTRVVVVR